MLLQRCLKRPAIACIEFDHQPGRAGERLRDFGIERKKGRYADMDRAKQIGGAASLMSDAVQGSSMRSAGGLCLVGDWIILGISKRKEKGNECGQQASASGDNAGSLYHVRRSWQRKCFVVHTFPYQKTLADV